MNISISNQWRPIPGYSGRYWINCIGEVRNKEKHIIKPLTNRAGELVVELRKLGQREKVSVLSLMEAVGYTARRDKDENV